MSNSFKSLMTSTRVLYRNEGQDIVVHQYGTGDDYSVQADITGPERELAAGDEPRILALLGTPNIADVNNISHWLHKTNAFILSLGRKESSERALVFDNNVHINRFVISCDGYIGNFRPALGWRRRA